MRSSRLVLLPLLGILTLAVGLIGGGWGAPRASAAGAASGTTMTASGFVPMTPVRVLDSRGHPEPAAQSTTVVGITGSHGIPATGVSAVVVNLTAVRPAARGYVATFPTGETRPTASTLNYVAGQTVANQAIIKLGDHGRISLYTLASTDLIVDVTGYYPTGSAYAPSSPTRILDTRSGDTPANGSTTRLVVTGKAGVPTTGVAAVVLNVTAVRPAGTGYVTVYPDGASRPVASTLNGTTDSTVAGMTIAKVGAGGAVDLYTSVAADLVVDVEGWIPTVSDYRPLTPTRILDTRSGLGAARGMVPAGQAVSVQVSGRGGVPADATAVEITLTAVKPVARGYVAAYPSGFARPTASTVNYTDGRTMANSATVRLGTDGRITLYTFAAADLLVDVTGYDTTQQVTAWVMTDMPYAQANIHSAPLFSAPVVGSYGPHARVSGVITGAWLHTDRGYVSLGTLENATSNPSDLNGRIPTSALCRVPLEWNAPHSFGGTSGGYTVHYTKGTQRYLNCIALAQLEGLQDAYRAHFGTWATIDLTYRSFYEQEYWWHLLGSPTAATPGTSNHGYGLAVDFEEDDTPDTFSWGHAGQTWLSQNAAAFGFVNPFRYGTPGESYHFEFHG